MHTATDRDDFVKINWDNVGQNVRLNFEKYTTYVTMYNTTYDYDSIMHYSRNAFALKENEDTITPFENAPRMGQRISKNEIQMKSYA